MRASARGSYPARAMICAPSRSACFSKSRLYRSSSVPRPNWLPWAMADPAAPPTTAPPTAPAIWPSCSHGFCAFDALAVPCRSSTCDELVRHDADHFALGRRRIEHAAVDEHRSARQREGVDLLQVHRRERILVDRLLELGRRHSHQAIAERRQIARDPLVLDDRVLLADFGGGLAADLDVLLRRVAVLRRPVHRPFCATAVRARDHRESRQGDATRAAGPGTSSLPPRPTGSFELKRSAAELTDYQGFTARAL